MARFNTFFDASAPNQPHTLYQREFGPELRAGLPSALHALVDWLPAAVVVALDDTVILIPPCIYSLVVISSIQNNYTG
jgi:hypothetical protein